MKEKKQSILNKKKKSLKSGEIFFAEFKNEVKKIEWPSKKELKSYTKISLISIFVFGMICYSVDIIIKNFLSGLSVLMKFFFG